MTTQERYEAMSLERLQAERDALLVRVDRWLTLGYMASAKVANLKLAKGSPSDSKIELLAIYLPSGAIPTLPKRCQKGGTSKQ